MSSGSLAPFRDSTCDSIPPSIDSIMLLNTMDTKSEARHKDEKNRDMKQPMSGSTFHLGLIEMGRIGEFAIRVVAAHVQTLMGIPVDILGSRDIPQEAFQHHRQQYDAGLIIRHLSGVPFPDHERILGLVTVDLCIPILTYVYGEAEVGGKVAVVSTFRLSQNDDGSPTSKERYYERLAKVALHEVAHTFSLYHCENRHCIMHFSPKIQELDRIVLSFCDRCSFMLREKLALTRSRATIQK
jgi:archaemetzincin